jgi:hypothetical protein
MNRTHSNLLLSAAMLLALGACHWASASDHGDVPAGPMLRQDANITDLHAFVAPGGKLVLSLCSNPAIPPSASSYRFPTDVTYEVFIDTDSEVDPSDPNNLGGTILHPESILEDLSYRIRFDASGRMRVVEGRRAGKHWVELPVPGVSVDAPGLVRAWSGLRDDPFIRGPRQGRNIAAIVLEAPLRHVHRREPKTLLIWATARVEEFDGTFQDYAGRSLRSMMPENNLMNLMHPSKQPGLLGKAPDVMIYDLSRPGHFPNGRALEDDVVDMVGDPRVLGNDAPFPDTNDVPFLAGFPYLAPPHPPVTP